jgi:hypothetical protein
MNWGKSIVLVFIGFALFIGVLVGVCMKQDVNLVSDNYYQEELDYQEQIDRIENAAVLQARPSINIVNDSLKVAYKDMSSVKSGVIKLTRASSTKNDVSFVVEGNQDVNEISFPLVNLPRGRYKGSFSWEMNGKEYYIDQPVDL